ncbi:hypothetical protein LXN10_01090 [Arcobacter sp. KX21116]|uniref:hypothetical protein n=1 Tax=Arcobacter iocasae TaxID=2906515 RepID=UPI0035D4D431
MIIDIEVIHSKPQEIIKKLLEGKCKRIGDELNQMKINLRSVNNLDFQPLEGA